MSNENSKMNFASSWSMAVGGMIGGGIFSVLGVVIQLSGSWAWLSFVLAGMIALFSAHSYSKLSLKYNEGGGSFTFLRKINREGFAGSLSWVLILGYILTMSVYAFTFGHYVSYVFGAGPLVSRILAIAIIALLTMVNLKGVGDASTLEIITVYGKLLVLIVMACYGLYLWNPEMLTEGIEPKPFTAAITGAATIFMAYEGFQLLSYDYEDLKNPSKTLPSSTIWAVIAVIIVYVLVTFGTTMIVGAQTLIEQKEIALSIVGKKAAGTAGLIIVTVAAAFSTGSAINATLFSTARLMENVAQKKDLPHLFIKENKNNIPLYSILVIAVFSGLLAVIGSLDKLVDVASVIFLFTFGIVNFIAYNQKIKYKYLSGLGGLLSFIALFISLYHQFEKSPFLVIGLIAVIASLFIFRPSILKYMNNQEDK